jgi:molybdopterin-binding protein
LRRSILAERFAVVDDITRRDLVFDQLPSGTGLMASISNEAVDELKLTKGMGVYAIIKASDVMVGTG